MAEAVIMPRQGQSVESCIITEWKKKEGDTVQEGDVLFSYETDKASFEEEAKTSGTLLKILAHEDDDVPVLETVAIIGEPGEDISALVASTGNASVDAAPQAEEQVTVPAASAAVPAPTAAESGGDSSGRLKASPRARMLAEEQGVRVEDAVPTGPHGRIIERDVRRLAAEERSAPTSAPKAAEAAVPTGVSEYEDIKLSNVRKAVSKSMTTSLQTAAQLTLNASFDASEVLTYRQRVKETRGMLGLANITINDIVLFAVSRVLPEHPELNAHFLDDHIRQFHHVNLGVAVDTPRGLLVPTITAADTLSLNALSGRMRELADQAHQGSISPDLLTGASFTVTNLGAFGIESFTPVINVPQVAILGVNTIETRVREEEGVIVPYSAMTLSLTFDHRALDGAPAARFLQALCRGLQDFTMLTAK